jgi:hypothetical protein
MAKSYIDYIISDLIYIKFNVYPEDYYCYFQEMGYFYILRKFFRFKFCNKIRIVQIWFALNNKIDKI